jgi:hypothetical protein
MTAPHAAAEHNPAKVYFFLTGEAGADLLPRVLSPFVTLGLVPYRVHTSTEHGSGAEMSLELRFAGVAQGTVETLAARCRKIIGVSSCLVVAET